jgi:hypothetical protein
MAASATSVKEFNVLKYSVIEEFYLLGHNAI